MLHVVLYQPEIPPNTGNIARLCAATGSILHLVGKLGFSLDDKHLKRAGLDYHELTSVTHYRDWSYYLEQNKGQRIWAFSTRGRRRYCEGRFTSGDALLFGPETRGLPDSILRKYTDATYHIPITSAIRSLNLSTVAGIALFESLRASEPFHGWPAKPRE